MGRLTDKKRAADLKANANSLQAAGLEPTISDQRYIKLAEYENHEERTNRNEKGRCVDCVYSTFHKWHLFCNKWRVERLLEECCSDFTNERG